MKIFNGASTNQLLILKVVLLTHADIINRADLGMEVMHERNAKMKFAIIALLGLVSVQAVTLHQLNARGPAPSLPTAAKIF
jgi:hypothetical protein